MYTVLGEITDPLDKAAIDAQLVGLDLSENEVHQASGFVGFPDCICIMVKFNIESEFTTFYDWLKTHGNTGGGTISRHDCVDIGPCVLDNEHTF